MLFPSNSPQLLALLVLVALLLLFEGLYLIWRSYRGAAATKLAERVWISVV